MIGERQINIRTELLANIAQGPADRQGTLAELEGCFIITAGLSHLIFVAADEDFVVAARAEGLTAENSNLQTPF
jgi:hypothetical protein